MGNCRTVGQLISAYVLNLRVARSGLNAGSLVPSPGVVLVLDGMMEAEALEQS